MSEPAQGWYPDPSGTPHLRWWNGHSWTNYVMPYAMQNQSVSKPRLPAHNEAVAPQGRQRLGARTAAAPALRAEASAPRDTKAHPPLTAKRGATPSPTTETGSAPSPRPTLTAEATPASSMESTSATSTQDAPQEAHHRSLGAGLRRLLDLGHRFHRRPRVHVVPPGRLQRDL